MAKTIKKTEPRKKKLVEITIATMQNKPIFVTSKKYENEEIAKKVLLNLNQHIEIKDFKEGGKYFCTDNFAEFFRVNGVTIWKHRESDNEVYKVIVM